MNGERILARSLSAAAVEDTYGNEWQYHPRSDHHSKVACWAILFDLLQDCSLLRRHAAAGKIAYGINHEMIDFSTGRHKRLDLVVCKPQAGSEGKRRTTLRDLASKYDVRLTVEERATLSELPTLERREVGEVYLAVEAKACMTAHVKAKPRLFAELTDAWQCINGTSPQAVAVGHGVVNASSEFISPTQNKFELETGEVTTNTEPQPRAAREAQEQIASVALRGKRSGDGYDALGITTIEMRNDGTPVRLADSPPALSPGDPHHYSKMIHRATSLYEDRFRDR